MYKTSILILVMLCLIGCQGRDDEGLPIEKKTLSLDTANIQEVRIIKPDLANLSNKNILVTISDKKPFDTLNQILNNAIHKDEEFEDILHDYEIDVLMKDGSSYTIRHWVKLKRFEDENAKNYILDSETSNKMNSFLKTLGLQ
ncbi:hypothetical protein RB620_22785 [Paenibacillus sp. LHD-117]|uniref:hypothetical protein n=1 Tax=Paenibacillus sp. LHD-117 TaxID=3071412 RepID=UPI0027DEFFA0|nr:hypothetical protein [Paenibacillus sp. LHD-117]MDQ6422258.1 hypothetical protein [Paenibacillus sp. LHD-117]